MPIPPHPSRAALPPGGGCRPPSAAPCRRSPPRSCWQLRLHEHEAQLVLQGPGTATVRILGRRMPGSEEVVITRTVTVAAE